jgi:ribonuclease R
VRLAGVDDERHQINLTLQEPKQEPVPASA